MTKDRVLSIQQEAFSPCAAQLITALDDWQNALYPPTSQHCTGLSRLEDDRLILLMARDAHGYAVGCLSLLLQQEGIGELKRLYVKPEMRGQRVAETLLQAIEARARDTGLQLLRLETGQHHLAALRFYQRQGYQRCEAFAPYTEDPLSVCMMKIIGKQQ